MSHSLAIFPQVKGLLDRVTSGLSGELRKYLTRYSTVGESRVHRVSSTRGLEALSGRLEGLSRALKIVPSRHVRLVNKPFLVHYANTSSLREYKKTVKQSIHAVLLFVTRGGDKIYCITCMCYNNECIIWRCHMMPWLFACSNSEKNSYSSMKGIFS